MSSNHIMKVMLTTGRADGDGNSWSPGDVIDLPDDEARRLLEQGSAEPVAEKARDRAEKRPARERAEAR